MRLSTLIRSCSALFLLFLSAFVAVAQEARFNVGDRVEGRFGSHWDHCSVKEVSKSGGYLLRCDSHPAQENVFAASDVRPNQGPDIAPTPPQPVPAVRAPVAQDAGPEVFRAIAPRGGVYACINQDGKEMGDLQFGLLDASRYSSAEGGAGKYNYAAASGHLTFISGPLKGVVYVRETEKAFRMLDENGARTAFMCPWTSRDPRKKHW